MIQKLIRNKTILAIASILLGIILVIARRSALDTLVRVGGYVLLAVAVGYLLQYFLGKNNRDEVQLGYAVLSAVGGILVILLAGAIVNFVPILLGIVLIINGVSNLSQAISNPALARRSVIESIIIIVLGVLVLFHPGALASAVVVVAGIALILNGLADLDMIRRFW